MNQTLSNSILQQNEFTDVLFWITLVVELWAFYKVYKKVHDPHLFGVLFIIIVSNIGDSAMYFIDGTLYNISLIRTAITMGLLCYVLVKINMSREKELEAVKKINEQLKNK